MRVTPKGLDPIEAGHLLEVEPLAAVDEVFVLERDGERWLIVPLQSAPDQPDPPAG